MILFPTVASFASFLDHKALFVSRVPYSTYITCGTFHTHAYLPTKYGYMVDTVASYLRQYARQSSSVDYRKEGEKTWPMYTL